MTAAVGPSSAMIDGVDVDAIAAAVLACPAVSGLYGGPGDVVASYLPGRRVAGVEVVDAEPHVYVRSRWAVPAAELLRQVSAALLPVLGRRHFEVVVADIDDPDAPAPALGASPPAPTVVTPKVVSVTPEEPGGPGAGSPPSPMASPL